MNNREIASLFIGLLIVILVVKIAKKKIKQERPKPRSTFGMPSSRSAILTFLAIYIILIHKHSIHISTILIILFTLLILFSFKYIIGDHSIIQLNVGTLFGTIIAFITYYFTQNKIL